MEGRIVDIEDAGASIRCFRHGWAFDLATGKGDRGNHKLTIWDIEVRDPLISGSDERTRRAEKEVWVRRRPSVAR
jgi:nitrite reductase/ring-hydroxylating ferredoxin subunit